MSAAHRPATDLTTNLRLIYVTGRRTRRVRCTRRITTVWWAIELVLGHSTPHPIVKRLASQQQLGGLGSPVNSPYGYVVKHCLQTISAHLGPKETPLTLSWRCYYSLCPNVLQRGGGTWEEGQVFDDGPRPHGPRTAWLQNRENDTQTRFAVLSKIVQLFRTMPDIRSFVGPLDG